MSSREIYHFIAKILALGTGPEYILHSSPGDDPPVGTAPHPPKTTSLPDTGTNGGLTSGTAPPAKSASHPTAGTPGNPLTRTAPHPLPDSGSASDPGEIISAISRNRVNWKQLVYIASNNFVLQALHLKFLQHGITSFLPGDLAGHLQHVYDLNLERNKKILDHCAEINRLLKSHDITPVFMKGAGNIIDGLYSDPGERIMADIDILTGPGHMEAAARLLIKEGFSAGEKFDPSRVEAMKHYPGLWREGLPAFVELHRLPVNIQHSAHFDYETVASQIRPAAADPSFSVMSDQHKIILSFCHSQLVHWGHQHARPPLRDLYDLLLLSMREDPARVFSLYPPFRGKAAGYLRIMHSTFGISSGFPGELQGRGKILLLRHNIAMKSPPAGRMLYRLLRVWRLYIGIPVRSLFSKNYRLYVRVRLRDPKWHKRNLGISLIGKKQKN